MTAYADALSPSLDLLSLVQEALSARRPMVEGRWVRWWRRLGQVGGCERPVRLRGASQAVDGSGPGRTLFSSAAEADGVLLKACGDRRASRCSGCAHTYRGDAYQLVATGLRGGKGVPATTAEHPRLFVTLTAPSFGVVHTQRRTAEGAVQPCHPRRDAGRCAHGRSRSCVDRHRDDDPLVGQPLCLDCYDVDGQVLFNAYAPELWRRTTIYLPRALAAAMGMTPKALNRRARISYLKVAEFQARGAVHFHAVLRLDAAPPRSDPKLVAPPPPEFTAGLLEAALRDVVEHAYVPVPQLPGRPPGEWLRWGTQLDVHEIRGGGELTEDQVAAYVAKYATKSTDVVAGPDRPLRSERDLDVLPADTSAHVRAAVAAAWRLGGHPELAKLRLRAWAHLLGFRGHFATKSGAYSTTFTALRQERAQWTERHAVEQADAGHGEQELDGEQGPPESVPGELRDDRSAASGSDDELGRAPGTTLVVGSWRFAGRGYTTPADAKLAAELAGQKRQRRRHDREAGQPDAGNPDLPRRS